MLGQVRYQVAILYAYLEPCPPGQRPREYSFTLDPFQRFQCNHVLRRLSFISNHIVEMKEGVACEINMGNELLLTN